MAYDATAASFTSTNFLRLMIGDTHATYMAFTDNELGALVTRFTTGSVVAWNVAAGWALRAAAASPERLWKWKQALGGDITLVELMDMAWERAAVLLG